MHRHESLERHLMDHREAHSMLSDSLHATKMEKEKEAFLLQAQVQQHREAHRKTEVESSFRYEEMQGQLQQKLTAMSRELSTTQEKVQFLESEVC